MAATISRGIKAPIIRENDDIAEIVVDSADYIFKSCVDFLFRKTENCSICVDILPAAHVRMKSCTKLYKA